MEQKQEEQQLKADKWHTMTISELNQQRDILNTKISKLLSLMGPEMPDSLRTLHQAHLQGLQFLNNIIQSKTK